MKIVIIDDHLAVAEAFSEALAKDFEVAGILTDGNALFEWLADHDVDVVLLDTTLPNCNIQDVIRRVCARGSSPKIVAMSIHGGEGDWRGLHRFGAHGVVSKIRSLRELVEAVSHIAASQTPLIDNERTEEGLAPTARQLDVLRMMASDLLLKEIALALGISVGRIDELVAELKVRLQVRTTIGLILRAIEMGWIEPRIAPDELSRRDRIQPETDLHSHISKNED